MLKIEQRNKGWKQRHMDQLQVKNPLTNITPLKAIHNLERKGYFNGTYDESQHVTDPDVLTLVAFRCQIATKDYIYSRKIYGYAKTLPAMESHYPVKPVPKTMIAINHILKEQIEAIEHSVYQHGKERLSQPVQLSLFDDVPNKIDLKLRELEKLESKSTTAMLNGELPFEDYEILNTYLNQLEEYYQGDLKEKPVLPNEHEKELLEELKTYQIPC